MKKLYFSKLATKNPLRLFSALLVFSMFFTSLIPGLQTGVTAQSQSVEEAESGESSSGDSAIEKEFSSAVQDEPDLQSLSSMGGNGRGRGGGGGGSFPATTPQWAIAATPGVKISINHEGWYRVSANDLEIAGFNLNSNRTYWQLFTDAVEKPLKINADGSIEFFGKGLDTPYTDSRVYYLINGQTAGQRIAVSNSNSSTSNYAANFDFTVERKQRSIYVPGLLNGEAENWFGDFISPSVPTMQDLTVTRPDVTGTARLAVKLQGITVNPHTVSVKFNNLTLGSVNFSNYQNLTAEFNVPMSAVVEGINQVAVQSQASGSDYSLIDSVRLTYKRLYSANNNSLRFSLQANKNLRVSDFSENNIRVFEIKNGEISKQIAVQTGQTGGGYAFSMTSSNQSRDLIAVADSQIESPVKVEMNIPSRWNSTANTADFVIITPEILRPYAQSLANQRTQQGIYTQVVAVEDIYDEFSYGAQSAQAVKDFLLHAATKWEMRPGYVLLFGDSSYDMRNYLGGQNRNLIPTKLIDTYFWETSSDSWLTDFDNDTVENIPIGRLPAGNEAEAAQMLAKLIRYDQQGDRAVRTGLFISDTIFASYSQELANILPSTAQASIINRSQMTDSQMQQEIFSRGSADPLLVTYTGHGSVFGWTDASLLSVGNAANLNNNKLSFYMIVGCLNGYSHDPSSDSLAEALLKTPNGAMGVFASSGSIIVSGPTAMSPVVTDKIFNTPQNSALRIGDILKLAKQASSDADTKRSYQLFGDPTVVIR